MRTWRRSPVILLGLSCLLLSALFIYVAAKVGARATQPFDQAIRQWMLTHQTPVGLVVFRTITRLGEQPALVTIAVIVAAALFRRGVGIRTLVCGVPFLCPFAVDQVKAWYQVMRPFDATDPTSFPSAHTSDCTAVAVVLGYALVRDRVSPRVGVALATGMPLIVGVSRVYLDRHWASDVTAGWIFGAAFALAICTLYELMRMRSAGMARIVLGLGGAHASNPQSGQPDGHSSPGSRGPSAASRGADAPTDSN